ncbi:MAG: hypothetical protein HQL64_03745 [Magnetococcales bacterium]|nr:hypothetical protein [Magnetococcales bacterium]
MVWHGVALTGEARRRAGAWLLLGLLSLAMSSLFALMLAAARAPGLTTWPWLDGFFSTALVLHVNLSATVWFLAFSGLLWSLGGGPGRAGMDWLALGCVALGALLLTLSPWLASGDPVLSDYLPTLRNPVFFAGFFCLFAGLALAAIRALLTIPPLGVISAFGVAGSGLFAAALLALLALVALVAAFLRLPVELTGKAYFDPLYWGVGHVLQFTHVLSMLTVWLVLARLSGVGLPWTHRTERGLLLLGSVPALLAVYPCLAYAPESWAYRHFFTALMSWGSWPVVPVLLGGLLWGRLRRSSPPDPAGRAADTALWGSAGLFASGLVLGGLIMGDTVMVTAHYHGTVGAVTLAYMGMSMALLPALGCPIQHPVHAGWQARLYASGLLILLLGLAWSGMHGAPRKTPLAAHGPDVVRAPEGMALMGAGATIALLATCLFLVLALRAMLAGRKRAGKSGIGPWPMAVLAMALIGAVGGVIHNLPDPLQPVLEEKQMDAVDVELTRHFQEGVVMLHAKRYEYALTAFHWVLQRSPEMPEAHVNMGFTLIGLEQYPAARDFFQTAIRLRSTQVNAYYGLAMALEGLHDLEGARGAMRTFIHLSQSASPFLPKARAALWEWEHPQPR